MAIFEVIRKDYPSLHTDDSELISAASYQTLKEVSESYEKIIGNQIQEDPEGQVNPIEYFVINLPDTLNK